MLDTCKQHVIGIDELLCHDRVRLRPYKIARSGIETAKPRPFQPQRNKNPVAGGHKPPGQNRRTALKRPHLRHKRGDRLFPKYRPVKAVAGIKRPFRRQLYRRLRPFVDYVKDPLAGNHKARRRRHVIMLPRPFGRAHPLNPSRRTDNRVIGNGIIRRIVQIMRPLVNIRRPRLDRFDPAANPVTDIGDAIGPENTQHLIEIKRHRGYRLLGYEQRRKVLYVRKCRAAELFGCDVAIQTQRLYMCPGSGNIRRTAVKTVYQEAVGVVDRSRKRPIAATVVNNKPPFDPRSLQNLPGQLLLRRRHGAGGD